MSVRMLCACACGFEPFDTVRDSGAPRLCVPLAAQVTSDGDDPEAQPFGR